MAKRRCGHVDVEHYMRWYIEHPLRNPFDDNAPIRAIVGLRCTGQYKHSKEHAMTRCRACGETLPLGPSRDYDPAVSVEMLAARIATDVADLTEWCMYVHGGYGEEVTRGWSGAESNAKEQTIEWHAGHLARVIHDHAITHGGEE